MSATAHGWCIMSSHVEASRHTVYVLYILAALSLLCARVTVSLPLTDFYPFDIHNDLHTAEVDDGGSGLINLSLNFPFFNKVDNKKIYVNNNGIISFLDKLTTYNPTNFSDKSYAENNAVIAPFWADIDIENVRDPDRFNETVRYRQTNESDILTKATTDVRNYFAESQNFSAEFVFIVTWYNVGYYGAAAAGKNKRNTFQCVMITDGVQSYVIFNYNQIVWTTGANGGGDPETGLPGLDGGQAAVVGFHSGHNGTYFELDHSGVREIINISRRSNLPVPVPGKYIFRVDGANVNNLSCSLSDKIIITPTTISMLGHRAIHVSGICLSTDFSVQARIPEIGQSFGCQVMRNGDAKCVVPPLFRTGELTFELNINGEGWKHSAILNSVNLLHEPAVLVRQNPAQWLAGKMVRVTWDSPSIPQSIEKTLEVLAYNKENVSFVTIGDKKVVEPSKVSRSFKLLADYSPYSTLVIRLCWESHELLLSVCSWSDVFPVTWKTQNSGKSQEWCDRWLEEEITLPRIVVKDPFCPCVQTMADNDVGHFHRDPICDSGPRNVSTNCIYNPDAVQCYRRNLKSATDNGETCCYSKQGLLMDIREHSGAGTHQRYHYKAQDGDTIVPFFSYFEGDLLPKLHCCQYSDGNCSGFITYRNATTCQGYTPPSPAQAAGDPHIVTLDGKNYSFNGLGDFYLVRHKDSSLVVQVRAVQATDEKGDPQNASIFSHVAVVMPSVSDAIEVRKNGVGADVLVNNRTITDISTSQHRNISIIKKDDGSYLIVLEPVSVSVTIEVTPDLLNIIVLIGEESYKGNILGLLGNYNKDPTDDFIARDGTLLRSNASMKDVHYNFGMTWKVPSNESYMSPDLTAESGQSYTPVFIGEIEDDNLREGAREVCQDNVQCLFDYTVTGKESIAKATMQFTNKFELLKKDLDQIVIRCPFLEIPENGNRTVTGYTNGSVATFNCDNEFEMVHGTPTRHCQKDSTWSGDDVQCAKKTTPPKSTSNLVIYLLAVGSTVGLVLFLIFLVGLYLRKRRKPKPDPGLPPLEMQQHMSVFESPIFMQSLQTLMKDGQFRIPRPHYVDPSIYVEYF